MPFLTSVRCLALLISCLSAGLISPVLAQTQPPTSSLTRYNTIPIASPTAASLGKFTDVPVSYHTGIPEVSVPLYTVKEGALTLPISLSYHAGGIKVQEPAGWVGLNWALNAGGVITRSIMGAPDESGTTNAQYGHFSHFGFNSYWTVGGRRSNNDPRPAPSDVNFMNNIYDGEPDLFFFNFNGYSGKFYFNDDRTPVVVDGQDLKIEYYYPGSGASPGLGSAGNNIQGFIITVPSGDRYYFGNTGDLPNGATLPVEQTYTYSGYSSIVDNNVYSSYYLHRIVAADKVHTITLSYDQEHYSYYTLSTFPKPDPSAGATFYYQNKEFALAKNNINGVRLTGIRFSTGRISFNAAATVRTDLGDYLAGGLDDLPNQEARALDNIAIADSSGFCKRFAFSYSYYGGDNTPLSYWLAPTNTSSSAIQSDKTRLRLDQVVEQACDGSVAAKPWVFTYNGSFLPRRLSFAQDHWGFYNGADFNNQLGTLIPTYSTDTPTRPGRETPGANRDAPTPYKTLGMQKVSLGILTQVTYPTGGSAQFEFEPNDVWVAYSKWEYLPPLNMTAHRTYSQHPYAYYTFNGNSYYRAKIKYYHDTNCQFNDPAIAIFGLDTNAYHFVSDTSIVSASPTYDFEEKVFTAASLGISPGRRRRIRLDISSSCSNDNAEAYLQEVVRRNVQEHAYAGGLRIKAVRLKATASDTALVTRYAYRHPSGHSSGALYVRPRYVQVVRNNFIAMFGYSGGNGTHQELTGCLNPDSSPSMTYLESPCSVLPMTTVQGSHIGYDIVTVTKPDNGRTEYHYTATTNLGRSYPDVCERQLVSNFCDPTVPNQPMPPAGYEYDRGQVQYQADYNAQGQVVRTLSYQHFYDSTRMVTPAYLVRSIKGATLANFYERRGYWQPQLIPTETRYDPQAPAYQTRKVQYFESPFHHQLTRTLTTASSGDTLEARTRYAFDIRTPAPDALSSGAPAYETACASCQATYQSQYGACTDDICRQNVYIDYALCRSAARQNYVSYRRQNFTNLQNEFQTRHDAAKAVATADLRALLQLQDEGRNEEVEASHWKNRRLLGATYTTFGPGLNQPAVFYPVRQFGLFLSTPTLSFAPVVVNGNQLQLDTRYATTPELALAFDRGTLVESRPKTGIVTSYLWGYGLTLPIAKAVGVRYTTLQGAYASVGNNLAALRTAPALNRAQLTTYIHQPLVGLRSQTAPTGRVMTYEYDGLGRLLRTRDEQSRILGQQQYHYAGQP